MSATKFHTHKNNRQNYSLHIDYVFQIYLLSEYVGKYKNKMTNLWLFNLYCSPPRSPSVMHILNHSILQFQFQLQFFNTNSIFQFPKTYKFILQYRSTNSICTNIIKFTNSISVLNLLFKIKVLPRKKTSNFIPGTSTS